MAMVKAYSNVGVGSVRANPYIRVWGLGNAKGVGICLRASYKPPIYLTVHSTVNGWTYYGPQGCVG
jgi:hypothetical protein